MRRSIIRPLGQNSTRRAVTSFARASDSPLFNKKCIITGATRGIGRAIAYRFRKAGASCLLIGRHEETLSQLVEDLRSSGPSNPAVSSGEAGELPTVDHLVGDVSDRAFWSSIENKMRSPEILVNAAGVNYQSLLVTTSPTKAEEIMDTNLMGPIWASQVLGKRMIKSKRGCIINISSILANKGGRGSVVYSSSKAGVLGLTRSLAVELGPAGIRVNAIVPGFIDTGMTKDMSQEKIVEAEETIPLRRFGTAEEVADAALFLATNEYASNCVLNLDGGLGGV